MLQRSAAALFVVVTLLVGVGAGASFATTGPDPHVVINVRLQEGRIVVSKLSVHDVTYVDFLVHNAGKLSHNFRVGGVSTSPLRSGQTVHLLVAFPAYGKYRFRCTLHTTPKMTGWFNVDRPVQP